jgi:hypothetical protein
MLCGWGAKPADRTQAHAASRSRRIPRPHLLSVYPGCSVAQRPGVAKGGYSSLPRPVQALDLMASKQESSPPWKLAVL